MKKIGKGMEFICIHMTIVLAAMFVTFWILDYFNPLMNFVNCEISNKLLLLFCLFSIATGVISIRKTKDEV